MKLLLRLILFLLPGLFPGSFSYAADLPQRGDVIISEVILDDDGHLGALPGVISPHTAQGDLVVELKNVSGKALDMNDLHMIFVVEPNSSVNSPLSTNHDVCGLDNSQDAISQTFALRSFGGAGYENNLNGVTSGDYLLIHWNGPVTNNAFGAGYLPATGDAGADVGTGWFAVKSAAPVVDGPNVDKHKLPTPAGSATYEAPGNVGYHRFYLGGMSENTGDSGHPDILDDRNSGGATTISTPYMNVVGGRNGGTGGLRLCYGNRFSNSNVFATENINGTAGTATAVERNAFTVILLGYDRSTETFTDILDVFSIGDPGEQSDIGLALANPAALAAAYGITFSGSPAAYTFDFDSELDMFDLGTDEELLDSGNRGMHEVAYQRTVASQTRAANSRTDYFKSLSSPGGDTVYPPTDASKYLTGIEVRLMRGGVPLVSSLSAPGDVQSTYRVRVSTSLSDPVASITANLVLQSSGAVNISSAMTLVNPASGLWEAVFSSSGTASGSSLQERNVRFDFTTEGGIPITTALEDGIFYTHSLGPEVNVFNRASPTGLGPHPDNTVFSVQASVIDTGTTIIGATSAQLRTTDGITIPDGNFNMSCGTGSGNITCSGTLDIDNLEVFNTTNYCFELDTQDGFGNTNNATNSCGDPFQILKRPRIKPGAFVRVPPGQQVVIDLKDPDYLATYNYPIGQVTFGNPAAGFPDSVVSCSLAGSMLTIAAPSVFSSGSCGIEVVGGDPGIGATAWEGSLTVLPDENSTVLNSLLLAPGQNPISPGTLGNFTQVSFADFFEVEARISDGQGISSTDNTAVLMHLVVTDTAAVPSAPVTAYSFYLYNDGIDFRQSPNMPPGAPFGTRYLYGYTLNDNNRVSTLASAPLGRTTFPPGPGGPNFNSFKIDPLSSLADDSWRIAIKPFDLQVSTTFQLDLEIKDNLGTVTYFPDVGRVKVAAGPGYVTKPVKDTWTEGDVSERTIALLGYECNGPFSVGTRKCGSEGNNQLNVSEHNSLYWGVESFDGRSDPPSGPRTGFFEYVNPSVLPLDQNFSDQFLLKGNPEACGFGSVQFTLYDSEGYRVTTDEFSVNVACVDDPPRYIPSIPQLNMPEDASNYAFDLSTMAAELSQLNPSDGNLLPDGAPLFGETTRTAMVWEIAYGHAGESVTQFTTWSISGTNLVVSGIPNSFHATGAFDTVVVCARDSTGNWASNGNLSHSTGTNNCVSLQLKVLDQGDSPMISVSGNLPATAIASPLIVTEDTPATFQVGIWDVDGPFPATWTTSVVTDPFGILGSITFSSPVLVGTTGETQQMLITPSMNRSGSATVVIRAQTGILSTTQEVMIQVNPGNDPPSFVGIPCPARPLISEKEDFGTTSSVLDFAAVTDVDLIDPFSPRTPADYAWSLGSVSYNGFIPFNSGSETAGMTAVAGVVSLNGLNTQTSIAGLFKVQISGNGTGGSIQLQSEPFAYGDATFNIRITDQGGLFAENSQCKLRVESVTNPPVIRQALFTANRNLNEDQEGYFFDLSPYELDPFNALTQDSELWWSVKLTQPSTLFTTPTSYPTHFQALLHAENLSSGVYDRVRLGKNVQGSIATTATSIHLDPVSDRLYIRPAPDVYGELALTLELNRTGSTPTTTNVTFSIASVNDPVRISPVNPQDPSVAANLFLELEETVSLQRLDLTTWANDARDFIPVTTNNNLIWGQTPPGLQSSDSNIFTIVCTNGQPFENGDADAGLLCLKPNQNVAYQQADATLNLTLNGNNPGDIAQSAVTVRLYGHNDYPMIQWASNPGLSLNTAVGRWEWRISEGAGPRTTDLKPFMLDEEEALSGQEKNMQWYMDDHPTTLSGTSPGLLNKSLSIGGFPFTLDLDQTSKSLTWQVTMPNLSGAVLPPVTFHLCDFSHPFYDIAGVNSTRTSRKCSASAVQFIVDAVNDPPTFSLPSVVATTLLTALEGGCISADLSPYVSDPDSVGQFSMQVVSSSLNPLTLDSSLFELPVVTSAGFVLRGSPLGRESNCSLPENTNATGPLSPKALRMFGSVEVSLILSDNAGASSSHIVTLNWLPDWTAPSIAKASAWSTSPLASNLIWSVKEDSSTSMVFLETSMPDLVLQDRDLGFGETIDGYHWSLESLGLTTNLLETSAFSLRIVTATTGDQIHLEPKPNGSTPLTTVALSVTDAHGRTGTRILQIEVQEENDFPYLSGTPLLCIGENSCFGEDTTTSFDFASILKDDFDVPPDALLVRIQASVNQNCTNGPSGASAYTTTRVSAVVAGTTVHFTGRPNQFHTLKANGITLDSEVVRFCLSDARSSSQMVLQTDLNVFVRPVNDPPVLSAPMHQASFLLLEGEARSVSLSVSDFADSGTHDYMSYFGVPEIRRVTSADPNALVTDDGDGLFALSYASPNLVLSANATFTTTVPHFYRILVRDTGDSIQMHNDWHLTYGPSETTTSVIISLTSTPVNDIPELCALGNIQTCSPFTSLTLETGEDQDQSINLNGLFRISDEENAASSSYAFSFNPSVVTTTSLFATSGGQIVRLELTNHLIGPNQRDAFVTGLNAVMQQPETTGVILGANLYLVDQSEAQWVARTLPINWTFRSINDAPTFVGNPLSLLIAKDSLDPVSLDLTPFKSDLDTPLNRVCFGVADYNPNMIQAFLPQEYGPAVFNQTNCTPTEEKLMAYALPGVIGRTTILLQLFDTTDLSSVTTSVSVQIVATEPLFDPALPKRAEVSSLILTNPAIRSFKASELLTDDQPIVVNLAQPNFFLNESDLNLSQAIPAGSRLLTLPAGFINVRIHPGTGDLEISGDYTRFEDGIRNFWLYYQDTNGNLGKMLVSVQKRHGYLSSLQFDDADGSGALSFGDRFLMRFSETSGGVDGVRATNSSPLLPVTTNNLASVLRGMNASSPIAFGAFGVPTPYSVELYSSEQVLVTTAGHYLQLTMNTGFIPQLNGVQTSHFASAPFQILSFRNGVTASNRTLNLTSLTDTVAPRLVAAQLKDRNGDGQFRSGDQLLVYFSEILKNPGSVSTQDLFELQGAVLGSDTVWELDKNRILLHLGQNALINPSSQMLLSAKNLFQDMAGNAVSQVRNSATLKTQDSFGPRVLSVELDKRSVSALPQGGDRLRVVLDEALDPASLSGLSADQILNLVSTSTFGANASVSLDSGNTVIVIELSSSSAGLNAGTLLRLNSQIRDTSGNGAYKDAVLADGGHLLPITDTVAPEVGLTYSRDGLIRDFLNPLTVINAGEMLLEMVFSEVQIGTPKITIRHQGFDVVSSQDLTLNEAVLPSGKGWYFRHQIRVEDGLNQVILSGDQDTVSGLALKQPQNASFYVDTRAPQLEVIFGAGSTEDNPTELSTINLAGSATETLADLRLQILTQAGSVSGSVAINTVDPRKFNLTLTNLQLGENRILLNGYDTAGNRGELTVSVHRSGADSGGGTTETANTGPDLDWDDDGVINAEDAFPRDPTEWEDTDGDGVGDNRDPDDDGDGVNDENENAIVIGGISWDFSKDSDNDGIPNAFDDDMDGDNIANQDESGVIPGALYPTGRMLDQDNDGLKMFEDPDDNNNGIPDIQEEPGITDYAAALNIVRPVTDIVGPLGAGEKAAGTRDGKILLPANSISTEYDLSVLGDEYADLKRVVLPRTENLEGIFPVFKTGPDLGANKFSELPAAHEVVGKVLEIRGKVKPGRSVEFPFPLPSYFANNTVVRAQDFRLQYYDTSLQSWMDAGRTLRLEGAVLYGSVPHFSQWRVLRSLNSVFDSNAGQSLSGVGSGTGGGGGGGGCFIVTAASGSGDHWLVLAYSWLRDQVLLPWIPVFVESYYRYSPACARTLGQSLGVRWLVFCLLLMPFGLLAVAGFGFFRWIGKRSKISRADLK